MRAARLTEIAFAWLAFCASRCSANDSVPRGKAAAPIAGGGKAPDGGPQVCATDAGVDGPYSAPDGSPDDSRCPTAWTDLTNSGGVCGVDGLVCVYPQGQAVCAADGPVLRWWQNGLGQGCSEFPPAVCQSCDAPGNVCEYLSEPGNTGNTLDSVTVFCCNGNSDRWQINGTGAGFAACPNGNVCGTIKASDYDQACVTDADCVGVTDGDLCNIGCTNCTNATINVRAQAQYNVDFAKKLSSPGICPCALGPSPVCKSGVCGFGP